MAEPTRRLHGADRIALSLKAHGVRQPFTLCGGHVSPILAASRAGGIRLVDVRDEATTLFAADASSRLSGIPGVVAGFGAEGTIVRQQHEVRGALEKARELARSGKPVLVNVWLDKTEFRKGSM